METDIKKLLLRNIFGCHIFRINSNNDEILDKIAKITAHQRAIIQISQGNISTKDFCDFAKKSMQICATYDSLLIIEDRIDVAQIIDASGVYLDKNSFSINQISNIISNDKIIGSSECFPNDVDYIVSEKSFDNMVTYVLNSDKAEFIAYIED